MFDRDLPADSDLIFGVLAVREGFVSPDRLLEAIRGRPGEGSGPLAEVLEREGALTPEQRAALEAMARDEGVVGAVETASWDDSRWADRLLRDVAQAMTGNGELSGLGIGPFATAEDGDIPDGETIDGPPPDGDRTQPIDPDADAADPPPPRCDRERPAPRRYRPLVLHSRGGIGQVYQARDEELGRVVALKVLQPKLERHPGYRSRFVIEAEINGNLEHPGIVPVYGYGSDASGRPFYAMRFVRGQSLQEAIEDFYREAPTLDEGARSLRLRRLLERFLVVCEAMGYAHSRGVLHRDLKPSNIMLGRFGETQIIDWGLAKATGRPDPASSLDGDPAEPGFLPGSGSGSEETHDGSRIGTPEYMSPEQAAGATASLGIPCDVYGLGATLFALLTGRPPVRGSSRGQILRRAERGEFPTPRSLVPDLPRPLEAICLKAMALRPDDRYASALALADDLRRWMADEPIAALDDRAADRLARWERRHRSLVRLGTAASLLLAGVSLVAALLISRARDQAEEARFEAEQNEGKANEAFVLAEMRRHEVEGLVDDLRVVSDNLLDPMIDWLHLMPGSAEIRERIATEFLRQNRLFLEAAAEDPDARRGVVRALRAVANLDRAIGRDVEAGLAYDEAIGLCDPASDPGLVALLRNERAEWHALNGRLAAASLDLDAAAALLQGDPAPAPAPAPEGEPAAPSRAFVEALTALNRSQLHFDRGQFEEALAHADRAVEGFEAWTAEVGPTIEARGFSIRARVRRAATLRELGRLTDAYEQAADTAHASLVFNRSQRFNPTAGVSLALAYGEWLRIRLAHPDERLRVLDDEELRGKVVGYTNVAASEMVSLLNQDHSIAQSLRYAIEAANDRAEVYLALDQDLEEAGKNARFVLNRLDEAPEPIRELPPMLSQRGRAERSLATLARLDGEPDDERAHLDRAAAAYDRAATLDPDRALDRREADGIRQQLADAPPAEPEG